MRVINVLARLFSPPKTITEKIIGDATPQRREANQNFTGYFSTWLFEFTELVSSSPLLPHYG